MTSTVVGVNLQIEASVSAPRTATHASVSGCFLLSFESAPQTATGPEEPQPAEDVSPKHEATAPLSGATGKNTAGTYSIIPSTVTGPVSGFPKILVDLKVLDTYLGLIYIF